LGDRHGAAEKVSGRRTGQRLHRVDHADWRRPDLHSRRDPRGRASSADQRQAWLAVAYNVFIAFAWAHWAWIKIATSVSVTVFSLSMLLIPVVGVLSGMIFLGERPSASETVAMLLILAALVTVVAPRRG
jgi:EamA domain-containing membrane protein RarD